MEITARNPNDRARAARPSDAGARSRSDWVARGAVAATPAKLRPVARKPDFERCPVCTCDEVRFDEVEFGRHMRLAECPRCEHRWTTPLATTRLTSGRRRMVAVHAASVDAAA